MKQFNAGMQRVLHARQTVLRGAEWFWYDCLSLLLRHHPVDEMSPKKDSRAPARTWSRDRNSLTLDIPSQNKISKGGKTKLAPCEVRQTSKI